MHALLLAFLLPALGPSAHAIRNIALPPARSDVAPESVTITPAPVYQTTNPTNGTGANINIIPSPGERTLVVTSRAASAGDTLTIVTTDMQGTNTTTTLTEGVAYACAAAASEAACALAIKTALDAHATLGPALNLVCTDGTCSDATIGFHVTSGFTAWLSVTSSDATGLTVTSGADGQVLVGPSIKGYWPQYSSVGDTDTGIELGRSANTIEFIANSGRSAYVSNTSFVFGVTVALGGNVLQQSRQTAQAIAAETLDVNDCGSIILNGTNGASFVLPDAAAANGGCVYTLVNTGARTAVGIGFSPNASDSISGSCGAVVIDGGANKDLLNTALTHEVGDSVSIVSDGTSAWYILSCNGIWAHE